MSTGSTPDDRGAAPTGVLFVCLGNICRSPLAEGVFLHLARKRGRADAYRADSAGTGHWHVGQPPDPRSVDVALRHGVHLAGTARQVAPEDFDLFHLVVAMDRDNLRDLRRIRPRTARRSRLILLREYDPEASDDLDVPDPYYGGADGFETVFGMVHRSCTTLLDRLEAGVYG